MDVQGISRCFIFILATLACSSTVDAGKLAGIRQATKEKKREPVQESSRSSKSSDSHVPNIEEPEPAAPRHNQRERNERSQAKGRKLESVRRAATTQNPVARRPSRSHRSRPRACAPHARGGFGFYSHYTSPVYLPTVVEQHHYYEAPVVSNPPLIVTEQPLVEQIEPIMTPEQLTTEGIQESVVVSDPFEVSSPLQVRFEIDYAGDEADVDRTGFGLLLNATGGIGIDTGVRIFRESGTDFRDHLWLGDFNIVYELYPTTFMRTRAGLGFNWMADGYGGEAGLNLTVGTELFAGPIIFSGEIDAGTLGDTDLLHGRLTASLRQGEHMEWFAGYDYLDIGGTEIRGVVGGLRFRF